LGHPLGTKQRKDNSMRLNVKVGWGEVRKLAMTVATAAKQVATVLRRRRHYQGRHRRSIAAAKPRTIFPTTVRPNATRLAPICPDNIRLWPPTA
jgi:hypothetical protein